MRITEIRAAGLRRGTPEGGWSNEIRPDDCVHTLIAVHTDEGVTGWGASSPTTRWCAARSAILRAALPRRERAGTGARQREAAPNTFWLGRGGSITHTISGIDIALWDILGKVTGQPVGRLLGGRYRERVRPYASILMEEPEPLADRPARRFGRRAFARSRSAGGRSGGTATPLDEAIVRAAREAVGRRLAC